MNRIFRRASLLMLAVLSFLFVSTTGCIQALKGQPPNINAGTDLPAVTNLIQDSVKRDRLRGAVVLIKKNNRVIYEKAFGDYSLNTVVPIASATKWISASVIMSLVDEGKISLDTPISKYLPNFTGDKGRITLRQLLSHTSGLPGNHRCLANQSITLAECVDRISEVSLQADPGTVFRYGGVSFQVAGRVAEVVSGKSWNTLFEERIKNSLNMVDTSYGQTENPRIAGGASSTVQDFANLLQMHLNGGVFNGRQVLSSTTVEEMQRDQTKGVPIAFTPQPDDRRYGLGEWLDVVGRNGRSVQLSSQGAFGFSPWIDRERNLVGVFLVRDRLRNVYGLVQDLQQTIRERVE
jgi:CubicO group peptidase (beta-lactamase class C family)